MARSFDGTENITLASAYTIGSPSGLLTWTIAAWVNPTNFATYRAIIGSQNTSLEIQLTQTNGNLSIVKQQTVAIGTSAAACSTGVWSFVGGSYDGTNWKTCVNGAFSSGVNAKTIVQNSSNMLIGSCTSVVDPFIGSIAHFSTWNVLLTNDEFTALSNGAIPFMIRPKSLYAYLPLDGITTTEPDFSGNLRNGTPNATSYISGPPISMFTPRGAMNILPVGAAPTAVFRKTGSRIGTRTGTRQTWAA